MHPYELYCMSETDSVLQISFSSSRAHCCALHSVHAISRTGNIPFFRIFYLKLASLCPLRRLLIRQRSAIAMNVSRLHHVVVECLLTCARIEDS